MSVIQAILIALVYYLGRSPFLAGPIGYYTIYRPVIGGWVVGIILGDPLAGMSIGATINLMYIGFISAGGALPGDMCLAGILGTALAISGGISTEAALALAVPIGLIGTIIWQGKMTVNSVFAHVADKAAAKGNPKEVWIGDVLLPQLFLFILTAIPCFLAVYFGSQVVEDIIAVFGGKILSVLTSIGSMMPALGIALNLKAIYKGEAKPFFFIGFLLLVYFNLSMIAIGLLGLLMAVIYIQITSKRSEETE